MDSIMNSLTPQIIYLDFDGENTIYRNNDLNLSLNVNVEDSRMNEEQKFYILSQLDKMYDDSDVVFTLSRPDDEEYSTVYIGKTDAFNEYGSYAGLAETIDKGNQIRNDNAFVFADHKSNLDTVISVIDHEVGHIVEGMEHDITVGNLEDYGSYSIPEVEMGLIYDNTNITKSGKPTYQEISFLFTCATSNEITISISPAPQYDFGSSHIVRFSITDLTTNLDFSYRSSSCTFSGVAGRKYQITIGPAIYQFTYSVTITGKNVSAPSPNPTPNGPDLKVTLVSGNRTIKSNESTTLSFSLSNVGTQYADSSYVYVYCDNKLLKTVHVGGISAFERRPKQVTISGRELGVGSHSIYIKADGSGIINEANENNNTSEPIQIVVSDTSTPTPDPSPNPTPPPDDNGPSPEPVNPEPDLVISNISTSNTSITKNQPLTLYFTVKNNGAAAAASSYVYIYEADRKVAQVFVSNLGVNKTIELQYTFAANSLSAGSHHFYVRADGSREITELNEENNYSDELYVTVQDISTPPTPTPTPTPDPPSSASADLTVSVPSGTQISIGADSKYTLTFTVKNLGTGTASASYAYIYSDKQKIGEIYVKNLSSGSSVSKSFSVIGSALGNGEHKLWVKVDGANTVSESNEYNNTSSEVTLKISGVTESKPDLILTDFYLNTSKIKTDDELWVYFELKNNGNAAAGASKLYLYDGQNALCAVDLAGMAAGESLSTYFIMSKGTFSTGTHSLWLKADATNLVTESNEGNNTSATKTLAVSNEPSYPDSPGSPENVNGVQWENISGNDFVVQYSKDNYAKILRIETRNKALDTFGLPAGTYQWQVKPEDGEFVNGNNIISNNTTAPQKFISDADGNMDLFFANAHGTWEAGYAAEHHGVRNGWIGTKEQVMLSGKNKIADVFSGSDDANVLVLTDDANGDSLFVEDIYTSFGKDAARFAQIDEIRAGAGDDIIDMTSQKFAYIGDEMTIHGGLGNDVIWAAGGDNDLFGDAGNDRIIGSKGFDLIVGGAGNDSMHTGGGGNDIFAFCENWGTDTIELTDSDSCIELWFTSGSVRNWDVTKRIYRDGNNSVTIIGGAGCYIDLKFGDEGGQYADMVSIGAFESAVSEKIFEDKNGGMLV